MDESGVTVQNMGSTFATENLFCIRAVAHSRTGLILDVFQDPDSKVLKICGSRFG